MRQPSLDILGAADIAACRSLLKDGSKTFFAASFLLPRSVRQPATALYAFCRLADDAVDRGGNADEILADLRQRLDLAYAGRPLDCPADRAFARTVQFYAIPKSVPQALIEGFVWDFECRCYATLADLEAYAARVAGTVGVMMAMVMGATAPAALARACDLGIAMQLTNIARDVGEDAARGRLYLPTSWLEEARVDVDRFLADPTFDERIGQVVARLLAEAERLYVRSEHGLTYLPASCRPGIRAARLLYAEIGAEVGRSGHDSVSRRAVVPMSRKLALLGQAYTTRAGIAPFDDEIIVPAAGFLVGASARQSTAGPVAAPPSWWNLPARIAWVIDLFERLERGERQLQPGQQQVLQPGLRFASAAR